MRLLCRRNECSGIYSTQLYNEWVKMGSFVFISKALTEWNSVHKISLNWFAHPWIQSFVTTIPVHAHMWMPSIKFDSKVFGLKNVGSHVNKLRYHNKPYENKNCSQNDGVYRLIVQTINSKRSKLTPKLEQKHKILHTMAFISLGRTLLFDVLTIELLFTRCKRT